MGMEHRKVRFWPPQATGTSRGPAPICWTLPLFVLLCGQPAIATADGEDTFLALPEVFDSQPFLRQERPSYRNFAFEPYSHQEEHAFPWNRDNDIGFQNRPRAFYSRFGDYVTTGFDMFSWEEKRQPGQITGSSLFKDWTTWHPVFDQLVVGRDSYRSWSYSLIVGDGMIARLTPLTLSKADFNGVRFDLTTPYFKLTTLGSRVARPNAEELPAMNRNGLEEHTTNSTLLLGSRAQADIGALQLGLNGVNLHTFLATGTNNSMKGIVRPDQPLFELLVVRFTDDSPPGTSRISTTTSKNTGNSTAGRSSSAPSSATPSTAARCDERQADTTSKIILQPRRKPIDTDRIVRKNKIVLISQPDL